MAISPPYPSAETEIQAVSVEAQIHAVKEGISSEIVVDGYISEDELKEILQLIQLTRLDISNIFGSPSR